MKDDFFSSIFGHFDESEASPLHFYGASKDLAGVRGWYIHQKMAKKEGEDWRHDCRSNDTQYCDISCKNLEYEEA